MVYSVLDVLSRYSMFFIVFVNSSLICLVFPAFSSYFTAALGMEYYFHMFYDVFEP